MNLRMPCIIPALLLASCSQTAPPRTPGAAIGPSSRAAVASAGTPRLELDQVLGAKLLPVHRIVYSRDASTMVVVSATGDVVYPPYYQNVVVQLWDAASGQPRATLLESLYEQEEEGDENAAGDGNTPGDAAGHGAAITDINAVTGAAMSPDGSLIGVAVRKTIEQAPAGEDQPEFVQIYRSSDQAMVREIAMPEDADGFALADARIVTITGLSAERNTRWVRSYDITTGRKLDTSEITHRSFSTAVQVPTWTTREWQRLRKQGLSFGAAARAQGLAWEPLDHVDTGTIHIALAGNLQRLAIWDEGAVEVWDISQHRLVARIDRCARVFDDANPGPPPVQTPASTRPPCERDMSGWIRDARLSDDGRSLVVLQFRGVFVWNLDSQMPGMAPSMIPSMAIDQCGAVRTWPEDAKRWPGAEQRGLPDDKDSWCGAPDMSVIALSSPDTLALGGSHSMPYPGEPKPEVGIIDVWNMDSRGYRHVSAGGAPSSLDVSADGRKLAVGAENASVIRVWSLPPGQPATLDHVLRTQGAPTGAVAFADEGRSVVTVLGHMTENAAPQGALEIWNLDDGRRLARTVVPEGKMPVCAVPAGERTWSAVLGAEPASRSAALEVWQPASGQRAVFSGKPWNSRTGVSCSTAASRLAMVTTGNTVEVLDIAGRGVIASFEFDDGQATATALSSNGAVLVAAVDSEQQSYVRLWELPEKSLKGDIRLAGEHGETGNHAVTALALSPNQSDQSDQSMIAIGTRAGRIFLCRAEPEVSCSQVAAHTSEITRLVFLPDGNALVSAGRDWRVLLWKIQK